MEREKKKLIEKRKQMLDNEPEQLAFFFSFLFFLVLLYKVKTL